MVRTHARLAALALAHLTAVGGVVVAVPAAAQEIEPGTTGENIRSAGYAQGRFVMQGNGRWVELDARGRVAFTFRENRRDQWSVYLSSDGRPVEIQIDVFRKMILIVEGNRPRRDLYPMTNASRSADPWTAPRRLDPPRRDDDRYDRDDDRSDRGGRGPGGGGPRGETFDILAGPIWNQRDAEQKCPALAYRAGGSWNGQWATLVQGRTSFCQIRLGR
ncbi:mannan-binding lectin [Sphingomonas sp. LT1P40]|uniref:mannan-binding lectin n=1 Tax=Alteristakelama amylovorans TaxID=3096166 RepID=UPI002FCC4881